MYGMGMFIPGTEVSFPEPPEVKPKQRTWRKGNACIDGAIRDRRQNMARLVVWRVGAAGEISWACPGRDVTSAGAVP